MFTETGHQHFDLKMVVVLERMNKPVGKVQANYRLVLWFPACYVTSSLALLPVRGLCIRVGGFARRNWQESWQSTFWMWRVLYLSSVNKRCIVRKNWLAKVKKNELEKPERNVQMNQLWYQKTSPREYLRGQTEHTHTLMHSHTLTHIYTHIPNLLSPLC